MDPGRLIAGIGLASCWLVLPSAGAEIRAGWASVEITPDTPVMLAGYASRKQPSVGVHDPLYARAIAFEQDQSRLVLISTDNLGFYGGTAESIRSSILDACELKPSQLFLCAIHTHSAPSLVLDPAKNYANNVDYTRNLQRNLVELTRTTLGRLASVRLGVGSGSCPVGVNRRELVDRNGAPAIVLGRNPSGPCDPEVQVLKLTGREAGSPAAILFGYATHSTSLGPGNLLVSGDIHGLAEQFVERQFGSGFVAAGFAGASGDIDPWFRVLPGFNTNNGWIPETVLLASMLGEEVAKVSERVSPASANGPVRSLFRTLELPGKTAAGGTPSTARMNITVARAGDAAFVGLGGEIFSQIGKAIKTGSPFAHTFIFAHCNGTAGYLPTAESYPAGGYEVQSTAFAAGAADQVVQETLKLLRELKAAE